MNVKTKKNFKVIFTVGLIISFISLFLDWYSVQIFDDGGVVIADWKYRFFSEWSTLIVSENLFGNLFKPEDLQVPIIIQLFYLGMILVCAYGIATTDLEKTRPLKKLIPYSYCNIITLLVSAFYIFIFPAMFLFPHDLYFPFLYYMNNTLNVSIQYSVDIGYLLQLIGYLFLFPYSFFYHRTITLFDTKDSSANGIVTERIRNSEEKIDLDKLINEEKIKKKLQRLDLEKELTVKNKPKTKKRRR